MTGKMHTIGTLSKLSGVSVRRVRFYSDRGLLPPSTRSDSGYRIYSDADVARLDLISALRRAGVGLEVIRKILARRLSLAQVLTLRLDALEAEIAAQSRVAAVLRATLRIPEPTETDLRRLWTMTHLSNTQFRMMLERFVDRVSEGGRTTEAWKRQMVESATAILPEDPSPEQIDAWTEIAAMITDEAFIAEMRAEMAGMWDDAFDPAAYAEASNRTLAQVRTAIDQDVSPKSSTGAAIAREWLDNQAKAMKRQPDAAFVQWQFDQYRKHHARSTRYQQLLGILRGENAEDAGREWRWIQEAMTPLLVEAP